MKLYITDYDWSDSFSDPYIDWPISQVKQCSSSQWFNTLFIGFISMFLNAVALNSLAVNSVNSKNVRSVLPIKKSGLPNVSIVQLIQGKSLHRNYPNALPTLLSAIDDRTTVKINNDPVIISSFEDSIIFDHPFIFVNFADRKNWSFSDLEKRNLKKYLERGGFIYIDAGINAEFLRKNRSHGQHHSFADWEASPVVKDAFKQIFPGKKFLPLKRTHPLFKSFYSGLPDPNHLPDSVRDFVIEEKWPQGTYSAVALTLKGRVAVLATPIISMGWGKNHLGNWSTNIRFRIRESTTGLSDYLETAAYSGERYESTREDGEKDVIYCQKEALPAWANEPDDRWRVFRYYQSREISDFAHVFYTQLGTNIFMYALTH